MELQDFVQSVGVRARGTVPTADSAAVGFADFFFIKRFDVADIQAACAAVARNLADPVAAGLVVAPMVCSP